MSAEIKPEDDVWIEVHEMTNGIAGFCRSIEIPTPQYGSSGARLVYHFNLTAYVKHMISKEQ